jgi:hypothetical protein
MIELDTTMDDKAEPELEAGMLETCGDDKETTLEDCKLD